MCVPLGPPFNPVAGWDRGATLLRPGGRLHYKTPPTSKSSEQAGALWVVFHGVAG